MQREEFPAGHNGKPFSAIFVYHYKVTLMSVLKLLKYPHGCGV